MNLTIGSTSIEITDCVRMRDTRKGFYLDITIPKENIGMETLYDLLDGCTENIIVTDDEGNVTEYVGFKTLGPFTIENGVYKVAQICTSEYEAQLSLAQAKIAEQDAKIATQDETIEAQAAEIAMLNDALLEALMA